ncbi:hypothetical protein RKD23_000002 [Streptomyces sp. SAI-170]
MREIAGSAQEVQHSLAESGVSSVRRRRHNGTRMAAGDEGAHVRAGEVLASRYRLEELLGRGGMGEVWRGFDTELQRAVAVKLLLGLPADDRIVARFRREALIGARLQHPGITVVHDVGWHDDRLFIVMELLQGRDLASRMAESPEGIPVAEAVRLAVQAAEALDAAHSRSVVHRDLKPANLFLLVGGRLQICDFGIARIIDGSTVLTATGGVIGTPAYMAPEQCRGEPVTAHCDLYALGCVLYALLTGTPPFGADGAWPAMMLRHVEEAPRSVREVRPEVPPALDALVLRLLAKDARERPDSAGEVARLLRSFGGPGAPGQAGTGADRHVSVGDGEAPSGLGRVAAADGKLTLEVRQTVVRLLAEAEQETRAAKERDETEPPRPRPAELARIAAYVDPAQPPPSIRTRARPDTPPHLQSASSHAANNTLDKSHRRRPRTPPTNLTKPGPARRDAGGAAHGHVAGRLQRAGGAVHLPADRGRVARRSDLGMSSFRTAARNGVLRTLRGNNMGSWSPWDTGGCMETGDLAAVAVGVLAAVATGTATGVGEQTGAAVVQVVRERLGTSERGRTALARLEAGEAAPGARAEAATVLDEELRADPGLRHLLSLHLNAPVTHTTGSVVINGGRVRSSQIALGPLTINKPNTLGGLLGLVIALLAVVALVVYGGLNLVGAADSSGDDTKPVRARALSVAETQEMMPRPDDLPEGWETGMAPAAAANGRGTCHLGGSDYLAAAEEEGIRPAVEFRAYACPDAQAAGEVYKWLTEPDEEHESPVVMPKFGDESTAITYLDQDAEAPEYSPLPEHVVARARVGTVAIEMDYGPVSEASDHLDRAVELMRMACDRARGAQAGS